MFQGIGAGGRMIGILEDRKKFYESENARLRSAHKIIDAKHSKEDGPAWTISSWLTSLSLLEIVAQNILDSHLADDLEPPSETQWIKTISDTQMEQAIDNSLPELKSQVLSNWRELKRQEHVDATEMNQKFLTEKHGFTFSYGDMEDYHGGLERLIGQPHPDIMDRMEWEHRRSPYSNTTFENNTNGGSTALKEFDYVVNFSGVVENADKGRNGYVLDALWKAGAYSAKLIEKAGLLREEVISLRLYTGPMYVWYNTILRFARYSLDELPVWGPAHIKTWKQNGWDTPFTTTLHVLNSAIIKLSKTMKALRVYRGTKGGILPEEFWQPNDMNVRGGIELGFMSTTLTRDVAMKFASDDENNPSLVFEIQMGMIDRGAPVKWCSQFPDEEEVLFAPLTGLEVVGQPRVEGGTIVVELRLNCNLHDLTIEQVTAKMKKTHTDLIHTIKLDMQMQDFSDKLMAPLTKHAQIHAAKAGRWYINADNYKSATDGALQAKLNACSDALLSDDASEKTKGAAVDVLFKSKDVGALAAGVKTLLQNKDLLEEHRDTLAEVARDADVEHLKDLRLDLSNLNLTTELPEAALRLLAWADSFNLSGNEFSNIKAGTALAHMVYETHRWRDAKMNWTGKKLTELGAAARHMHSGELTINRATLKIKDLRNLATIDLSGQGLDHRDAEVVAAIIPTNRALTSLDVSGNVERRSSHGPEFAKRVAEGIKGHRTLVSVNLSRNQLKAESAEAIAKVLPQCEALTSVNMLRNAIGREQAEALCAVQASHPSLKTLCGLDPDATEADLSGRGLKSHDAILVANDLKVNRALTSVDVSDNNIVNKTSFAKKAEVSGSSFNVGASVTYKGEPYIVSKGEDSHGELRILEVAGIFALCDAVQGNNKITTLNLAKIGLRQSAQRIAEILPTMTALTSVNVANNPTIITEHDDGSGTFDLPALQTLLDAFAAMPSLASVNFSGLVAQYCTNGHDVAKAVAGVLPQYKALTSFTFSGDYNYSKPVTLEVSMSEADMSNKILKSSGAIMAAAFLPRMEALSSVNLSKNRIDAEGAKAIATALPLYKALTSMDLSENNLTRGALKEGKQYATGASDYETDMTGITALSQALPKCPALTCVNLADNSIRDEEAEALAAVLSQCPSLRKLMMQKNKISEAAAAKIQSAEQTGLSVQLQ